LTVYSGEYIRASLRILRIIQKSGSTSCNDLPLF
jgi:hypothetical protein